MARLLTDLEYGNMLTSQDGKCAICRNHQRYQRLAVDHCHKTHQIRGLLCMNCNRGLGHFFDSPFRLQSAIDYLAKARQEIENKTARFVKR